MGYRFPWQRPQLRSTRDGQVPGSRSEARDGPLAHRNWAGCGPPTLQEGRLRDALAFGVRPPDTPASVAGTHVPGPCLLRHGGTFAGGTAGSGAHCTATGVWGNTPLWLPQPAWWFPRIPGRQGQRTQSNCEGQTWSVPGGLTLLTGLGVLDVRDGLRAQGPDRYPQLPGRGREEGDGTALDLQNHRPQLRPGTAEREAGCGRGRLPAGLSSEGPGNPTSRCCSHVSVDPALRSIFML